MIPFIPILLVLAGLTLLLSRRRYKAIEYQEPARIIVKGHTYSESVENTPSEQRKGCKVENVRRCCVIGAGRVGALTGIVLASQNPDVQLYVVDGDERLISAWKADKPPFFEPGLDEMLFDQRGEGTQRAKGRQTTEGIQTTESPRKTSKLPNLTFSTDIHAGIAAADLIFICLEPRFPLFDDEIQPDISALERTLQDIAHASTGHKIIVQKTTAPCGIVHEIKKRLQSIASPTATFDILSNPEFTLPGTSLQDLLYPPRIIIGHIYSPDMSPTSITALKRLYTPWVPEDRIVTMDAWSAELGKMAANALIAQQIASLNALSVLCEATGADLRNVVDMAGCSGLAQCGGAWVMGEVRCLVYLARELGLQYVAGYWASVLGMEAFHYRRVAGRIVAALSPASGGEQRVAVLGVWGVEGTALDLVRELKNSGLHISIYDARATSEQMERALRGVGCQLEGVTVSESLEEACLGCSAVVLHADWDRFSRDQGRWEHIASEMVEPRVFFDPGGVMDRVRMQEMGFEVLRLGVKSSV